MLYVSLFLVSAGLFIVIVSLRRHPVSLKNLTANYLNSKLIHANIINLLLIYLALPLFFYFVDPFEIKFYTGYIDAKLLAWYHLTVTHSFFAQITAEHVFICVILSAILDLILFSACSLLSLIVNNGWKAIVMNVIMFYLTLIQLNLIFF